MSFFQLNLKTRGPWATSLAWENNTNQYTHMIIIILINRMRIYWEMINIMRIELFLIWTNLNPLHPMMLCAKRGWNCPSGSEEEDYQISSNMNIFSLFRNYFPLEKNGALHLNKIESPSNNDELWQVCLKLAQWFERRIF